MKLKSIKLKKGMTKDEVNKLISDCILLEDDVYLGALYKHHWKCLCGNVFLRIFSDIKNNERVDCGCSQYNKIELRYKTEVEKTGEYEYIRSYRRGDILPNGKIVGDSPYIQIKHKYCGSIYEVQANGFMKQIYRCTHCCKTYENSFAYHIEVELGLKLEDVWDFDKNTVSPYHIWKNYNGKVWVKCLNGEINKLNGLMKKDYHGSYEIRCNNFVNGKRCGYCNHFASQGKKIHPLDSFGYHNFDKVMSWYPDNDVSPFKISRCSRKKYKFICEECGEHFLQSPDNITRIDTWCPQCSSSKGEKMVKRYLLEHNIKHIQQMEFYNLTGINNGNLRYDFYLPEYNLLIEYQGEFHDGNVNCQTSTDFKRQQEHDIRKRRYAIKNNIKLLEIWYWDYASIYKILENELK